jgi:hypothetical protein
MKKVLQETGSDKMPWKVEFERKVKKLKRETF